MLLERDQGDPEELEPCTRGCADDTGYELSASITFLVYGGSGFDEFGMSKRPVKAREL